MRYLGVKISKQRKSSGRHPDTHYVLLPRVTQLPRTRAQAPSPAAGSLQISAPGARQCPHLPPTCGLWGLAPISHPGASQHPWTLLLGTFPGLGSAADFPWFSGLLSRSVLNPSFSWPVHPDTHHSPPPRRSEDPASSSRWRRTRATLTALPWAGPSPLPT